MLSSRNNVYHDQIGELGYAIGHSPPIVTLRDTHLPKLLSGELCVAAV